MYYDQMIQSRSLITYHYLTHMFAIDLIAIVPCARHTDPCLL